MPDVFTKEKRSEVMSRIRGKNNKETELALARLLREHGLKGWRRQYPIPGRPDFVFPKVRLAIFVDGCFWHQCPKCSNMPANNREFWERKLGRNVERDREVTERLTASGWAVLRIWEHDMKKPAAAIEQIRVMTEVTGGPPAPRHRKARQAIHAFQDPRKDR